MYRSVILALFALSGWANALTLSPMYFNELAYSDFYMARMEIENNSESARYYDVWVTIDPYASVPEEGSQYTWSEVLGSNEYKTISVPILNINPDQLEVRYVCVQERPNYGKLEVVGRACSKLRLYWPRSELLKLQ
ncbi:hypothetical protein VPHD81_0031 [Vibrio phage D81]